MSNVTLHPTTIKAINSEMAAYEAREARLLVEISKLHKAIGGMVHHCEEALKDCMLPGNVQALHLQRAIQIATETL